MTHAINSTEVLSDFRQFIGQSSSGPDRGLGLFGVFGWALVVFKGERLSRKALDALRSNIVACTAACDSGKCLAGFYKTASTVRDNYLSIVANMEPLPIPRFVKRRVAESLAEWDDLAEDCAIGGDPEIRAALNDIAARL